MNKLVPIPEKEATGELKNVYERIKNAFGLYTLPVFFTYMGPFPEYLSYISEQLIANLGDSSFEKLVQEEKSAIISKTQNTLFYSKAVIEWREWYKHTSSFYSFQKDLHTIIAGNIKLTFIFLSLRDAVKGWAVAAKRLPDSIEERKDSISIKEEQKDEFIRGEILPMLNRSEKEKNIGYSDNQIAVRGKGEIEKNRLPEYLLLLEKDFSRNKTREEFWHLRVTLEKNMLQKLELFPHLIFSPYNLIVKYTEKYENFFELIYLLSEQFPTLSMQRLLYSAFLYVKS